MSTFPSMPPPPPAPTAEQPMTSNGLAVAGMILGICSIIFCWWGIATLAMVVLALTFSGVALKNVNTKGAPNKGMAIAGLATGVVGFIAYFIFAVSTSGVGFFL
jgi:hypothetical protein